MQFLLVEFRFVSVSNLLVPNEDGKKSQVMMGFPQNENNNMTENRMVALTFF